MPTSAQGIAGTATLFRGVVHRRELVRVVLLDYMDEPIKNTRCMVTFADGQTTEVKSNEEAVVEFLRKAEGEITIDVLEE